MNCINKEDTHCPMCGREFHDPTTQLHHLKPKTFKGKDTVRIHKVCHQKIHATLSERELDNYYHTIERLLEHEQIAKFMKWLQKKPPEFYDKNDETKQRKSKRRR
jgi:hypothetical protein